MVLDTDVVLELIQPAPAERVVDFLNRADSPLLSVMVFYELNFGLQRFPQGSRKTQVIAFIDVIRSRFSRQLLDVDLTIAEKAGQLRAEEARKGRVLGPIDAIMAATAFIHGATLVTRNTKDFRHLSINLIDPWTS